ncbi:hypothetical protein HDU76_013658 [Blyttiomyces sp. JEL0837]|nr:hypothetical protein HDU76_013658 [Blyttiomyces sp. JEL0837]
MFCAISGEVPQEPVISKKTGHVYEKRLILKYIAESGKEPATGDTLTEDDLLPIQMNSKIVKPRPPTVNSVPALLSLLQNEWDSVMLETYQLKQQHYHLKQELSNALYENDAAKRVIARLARERDQARENLAAITAAAATAVAVPAPAAGGDTGAGAMEVDEPAAPALVGVNEEIAKKMDEVAAELTQGRRKRKVKPEVATQDQIKSLSTTSEIPSLHSASTPGITSIDLFESTGDDARSWVLTGGKDGALLIHDWKDEGKQVVSVKAHGGKKVNDVAFLDRGALRGTGYLSAGVDKTAKVWKVARGDGGEGEWHTGRAEHVFKGHGGEVTALALHPCGDYFASVSLDSAWAFNDIESGSQVSKISNPDVTSGYSAVSFHPDGLILGTGTVDSKIRLWEVKSATNVQVFEGQHVGKITSVSFSENGYYLATAADGESVVKLWDLRKCTNFHTIDLGLSEQGVARVAFDYSGQYLGAAAGSEIKVFLNKQWTELAKLTPHGTSEITDFKFGENAQCLLSSGTDRKVVVSAF